MDIKKVVIACDSFKGSMTSMQASKAIKKGIETVYESSEIKIIPMTDGGEGFVDTLVSARVGDITKVCVQNPIFNLVEAYFGVINETAVIEMAQASGLTLLETYQRNPMKTTTYGTGELIKAALDHGFKHIMIGIGGSATNDGGIGMAAALGARFIDEAGKEVALTGEGMGAVSHIDLSRLDKRLYDVHIEVATDVRNPLYGKTGAAYVYGPQKGANLDMIETLDRSLRRLADVIKRDIGMDVAEMSGAGAAGGLGAGLAAFLGAKLKSGIELVLDMVKFEEMTIDADLVITGEGRIDGQSIYGKVPYGVAKRAKQYDIPVVALVGAVGEDYKAVYSHGIDAVFSISRDLMPFEDIKHHAQDYIFQTTTDVMRLLKKM